MGVVVRLSPFYYVNASANPTITIDAGNTTEVSKIQDCCIQINDDIKTDVLTGKSGNKSQQELQWDYLEYKLEAGTGVSKGAKTTITITINQTRYKALSQEKRQDLMEIALTGIQNSGMSTTNRNKMYNFVSKSDEATASLVRQLSNDVNADFGEAYSMFKPFTGVLGTFLGVLSLLIFILLGITVTIDLAYINIPAFQIFCMGATKEEKPKFVSIEAVNAVKESETKPDTSSGVAYFRMKTKQFIALGVCLLYLVSGKLYVLLANIIDYFQGVLPD